jgi:hypothetical protein
MNGIELNYYRLRAKLQLVKSGAHDAVLCRKQLGHGACPFRILCAQGPDTLAPSPNSNT